MEWIIQIVGKFIFMGLDFYMKKVSKDKQMIESYYEFLKMVDESGTAKVEGLLAAEDALAKKQRELRKELEDEATDI